MKLDCLGLVFWGAFWAGAAFVNDWHLYANDAAQTAFDAVRGVLADATKVEHLVVLGLLVLLVWTSLSGRIKRR